MTCPGETCQEGKAVWVLPCSQGGSCHGLPQLSGAAEKRCLRLRVPHGLRGSTRSLGPRTPLLARDVPNDRSFLRHPTPDPTVQPCQHPPAAGLNGQGTKLPSPGLLAVAERRGRLPVPALPTARPASPARAPGTEVGAAPGSLQPCLRAAEMESQQTAPGRDSAPALPGTQAANSPPGACQHPGSRRGSGVGHPRPGTAAGQFWGRGAWRDAELSTAAPQWRIGGGHGGSPGAWQCPWGGGRQCPGTRPRSPAGLHGSHGLRAAMAACVIPVL